MPGPGYYMFGDEERKELLDVMEYGHLSRYGEPDDKRFKQKVLTFEKEFAAYTGTRYAQATSGGTAALMCCFAALGIGPGDEVIVPCYMFVATLTAAIQMRAVPVLAEIDESLTMDPDDFERKITPRTKAVIAVHTLGNPCDMDRILAIADRHNIIVIEDACQAAGASYKGKKTGSMGKMAAFSLNFYKTITAGDGGIAVTNEPELYRRSFAFTDQGYDPGFSPQIGESPICGVNLRMNELTGAVALAQLRKLDTIVNMLRAKKHMLKEMIGELPSGVKYRRLNDPQECGTVMPIIFDDPQKAEAFAAGLNSCVLTHTGYHVYSNLKQVREKRTVSEFQCPFTCPVYKGGETDYTRPMPQSDDIIGRTVNISVGVVDGGLGTHFGINILSSEDEIRQVAHKIKSLL